MQISKKPVFGFGFDSYRAINPIYQSNEVRSERMKGLKAAHSKYTPLVAFGHSEWLQKISEFGFLGVMLITPIIMAILINFIKCKSLLLKILFAGCFMFLTYSLIDFPAQTPVCLMTFSILLGLSFKYSELGNRRNP
jgi:O-antigen ligase